MPSETGNVPDPPAPPLPANYQLIGFVVVGNVLRATIRTPLGDVYQGSVVNWQKVTAIEVPK